MAFYLFNSSLHRSKLNLAQQLPALFRLDWSNYFWIEISLNACNYNTGIVKFSICTPTATVFTMNPILNKCLQFDLPEAVFLHESFTMADTIFDLIQVCFFSYLFSCSRKQRIFFFQFVASRCSAAQRSKMPVLFLDGKVLFEFL